MVPTFGPAVSTKEPLSHVYSNQVLKYSSLCVSVGRTAVDVRTELATAFHHLLSLVVLSCCKVSQDDGFLLLTPTISSSYHGAVPAALYNTDGSDWSVNVMQ